MKKLILLICLTILLKPIVPVLQYVANYEYIKTELCVNKDIPIIGCNGKCYLIKQLAKASESEKPVSNDKKHAVAETSDLFLNEINSFHFSYHKPESVPLNSAYSDLYSHLETSALFRPPLFIS